MRSRVVDKAVVDKAVVDKAVVDRAVRVDKAVRVLAARQVARVS
jgi:hypothetical protein